MAGQRSIGWRGCGGCLVSLDLRPMTASHTIKPNSSPHPNNPRSLVQYFLSTSHTTAIRFANIFSQFSVQQYYNTTSAMPFSANWQEKRVHLCVLAALSVTIMLFTGVHLRHMIPTRQNWRHHTLDCNSFYASDIVECAHAPKMDDHNAGKEDWL